MLPLLISTVKRLTSVSEWSAAEFESVLYSLGKAMTGLKEY